MIPSYWLLVALFVGGQVTSIVEYIKNYNLTDLEKDKLEKIKSSAEAEIAKVRARL